MEQTYQSTSRTQPLPDREFRRLAEFIYAECGIKLPPTKKTMLEARLHKRLRTLNLESYSTYCDYLFSSSASSTR